METDAEGGFSSEEREEASKMKKIDRAKKVFTRSGELWKVEKVVRPNPKDCFVLLSVETKSVHEVARGKFIPALDMLCVDYHNDELYPNSSSNRRLFKEIAAKEEEIRKLKEELVSFWFWEDDPEDDWL